MIVEGLLSTIDEEGLPHWSVMGPRVDERLEQFELRPFQGSRTLAHLTARPSAVFHVVDDVELLAGVVCDAFPPNLKIRPAAHVEGFVCDRACRYFELRVVSVDRLPQRAVVRCDAVHRAHLRDFLGFNRGKHAVLEAAILATRIGIVADEEIAAQWPIFQRLVDKTGGDAERRALRQLAEYIAGRCRVAL